MCLFTPEQSEQLFEHGQPEHQGRDWLPVAKLILPGTGCAWLLSEIRTGINRLYGYGITDYGTGAIHAGFIDLSALEWMAEPLTGERVRQDTSFDPRYGMSVYLTAARMCSAITDDEELLQEALAFNRAHDQVPDSFVTAILPKLVL